MYTLDAVILAAGKGTRMRSSKPKVLHTLLGESMLNLVIHAAASIPNINDLKIVIGHQADLVQSEIEKIRCNYDVSLSSIEQKTQKGTGHALMMALPRLDDCSHIIVLNGDAPLIDTQLLISFLKQSDGADIAFLTIDLQDAGSYGRVIRRNGHVCSIVEAKDFDPAIYGPLQNAHEINTGIYVFSVPVIKKFLPQLSCKNNNGEYYITDLISLAHNAGMDVRGIPALTIGCDQEVLLGVNTPQELAEAEKLLQSRINATMLKNGIVVHASESVRVSPFSVIEPGAEIFGPIEIYGSTLIKHDSIIHSNCVIRDSVIDTGAEIREFCHIEGAHISTGAIIGPFARLRAGSFIDEDAHVGDSVELKKTHLGKGSKANHLTYLGDCTVGQGVNIGAGTITCNYDGKNKYATTICDGSFIGSNSALVAPVTIGKNTLVGAGSVITKNVPDGELAVARQRQINLHRK